MIAHVILRKSDGTSIADTNRAMTAKNIDLYRVGDAVIQEASAKLEAMGFRVLSSGAVDLTIDGPKTLLETTFQTTIVQADPSDTIKGTGDTQQHPYTNVMPFIVPDELSDLIAQVVLPIPPQMFAS